tara:strand:+ start:44127 stop:44828 length:702 start_codon:yes stop_codon:yes gene_type:complete
MKYNKQLIVALDFSDEKACLDFLDQLNPDLCRVKIGKELFTHYGPALVSSVQSRGFEIFLDLKFHDIPNTVAAAVRAAADLGIWMVNVHASGGRAMLEAARNALPDSQAPLLIAVTVLTSLGEQELKELGIADKPEDQVIRLASLTADCGLDGVVCSAREAPLLRQALPADFKLVTPGIRPAGDKADDQKRIVTPTDALARGSDYLVIGRPITRADNPGAKLASIIEEIQAAS